MIKVFSQIQLTLLIALSLRPERMPSEDVFQCFHQHSKRLLKNTKMPGTAEGSIIIITENLTVVTGNGFCLKIGQHSIFLIIWKIK